MMYLYGRHVYEWSVEQLSYYISFMGVSRAIFLLFLLPGTLYLDFMFSIPMLYFSVHLLLQAKVVTFE